MKRLSLAKGTSLASQIWPGDENNFKLFIKQAVQLKND
jgi:hypothetical protein